MIVATPDTMDSQYILHRSMYHYLLVVLTHVGPSEEHIEILIVFDDYCHFVAQCILSQL